MRKIFFFLVAECTQAEKNNKCYLILIDYGIMYNHLN